MLSFANKLFLATPIRRNIAANIYGQFVTFGFQFAQIPILLIVWGSDYYADWIVLMTIPSLLHLADFGLGLTAGNRVIALREAGDAGKADDLLQAATIGILLIALGLGLFGWVFPHLIDLIHLFGLRGMGGPEANFLFGALVGQAALTVILTQSRMAFRVGGRYAHVLTVITTYRLAACGLFLGLVSLKVNPLAAVWVQNAAFGACFLHLWFAQPRRPRINRSGLSRTIAHLRPIFYPSMASLGIPLTAGVLQQVTTILVSRLIGPEALITFNTHRVVARTVFLAQNFITNSSWTEYARLFARAERTRFISITRKSLYLSGILGIGTSILLLLSSPFLETIWLQGKISIQPVHLLAWILIFFAHSVWRILFTPLLGTNRNVAFVILHLGMTGLALLVFASALMNWDLTAGLMVLLALEGSSLVLSIILYRQLLRKMPTSPAGIAPEMAGLPTPN